MTQVRIVIGEDSLLVRSGLETLIGTDPDLHVVGSCASYHELLDAVERERPDVVITDIRMPPSKTDEGIRLAGVLRCTNPATAVLVVSQYADAAYAMKLMEQGSGGRGYLLKERLGHPDQLFTAIRTVHGGGSIVDPVIIEALVAARTSRSDSPLRWLTPREREILGQLATGRSNAAIAAELFVSDRAVEKHINSIFSKLALTDDGDTHRRVKAVLMFLDPSAD